VYYFLGMQNMEGGPVSILQPMLAYEGNEWTGASWACCPSNITTSPPQTFKIRISWGYSWGETGYMRIDNSVSNPYCSYNTAPFVAKINVDVTV